MVRLENLIVLGQHILHCILYDCVLKSVVVVLISPRKSYLVEAQLAASETLSLPIHPPKANTIRTCAKRKGLSPPGGLFLGAKVKADRGGTRTHNLSLDSPSLGGPHATVAPPDLAWHLEPATASKNG